MIVAAYGRVSTSKEDQERSYEAQQSFFEREIANQGHELFKFYGDKGLTGTKLDNRKSFNEMLEDAGIDVVKTERVDKEKNQYQNLDTRKHTVHTNFELSVRTPKFQEIWIKNTSRFARNTLSFELIELLRKKKVFIYFVEQNINTRDERSDNLLKILQIFDESESIEKSSKVKFGQIENAKTKKTIATTSNIYGYKYIKETNYLKIIKEEAEVIRLIYALYLDGYGRRKIIDYLTNNNLLTRKGRPFCESTISRILCNEKYCGTNVRNKYTYGSVKNKKTSAEINDKDEWIIQKNHERIEPIIDEETFIKAQEIRKEKINRKNQLGIYKGTSEYAGKIYCGECKSVYHSNSDKGRKFYNCSAKKREGISRCNNSNISKSELDSYINQFNIKASQIESIKNSREQLNNVINYLKSQISIDNDNVVENINIKIDDLKNQRNRLIALYEKDILSTEELDERIEKKEKEITYMKCQRRIFGRSNAEYKEDILSIEQTINSLEELQNTLINGNTNNNRAEILEDVDKIFLYKNKVIKIVTKLETFVTELCSKHIQLYEELNENNNLGNVL